MKNLKIISTLALLIILSSCATTLKFPSSDVTPAADISATKKEDKHGNYKVTLTAKNLASPDRLNPPKNTYVVWIVTTSDGIRKLGQLKNKNVKTAEIETLTPFAFTEIFITAEDNIDISYPSGIEIARARFKK